LRLANEKRPRGLGGKLNCGADIKGLLKDTGPAVPQQIAANFAKLPCRERSSTRLRLLAALIAALFCRVALSNRVADRQTSPA